MGLSANLKEQKQDSIFSVLLNVLKKAQDLIMQIKYRNVQDKKLPKGFDVA